MVAVLGVSLGTLLADFLQSPNSIRILRMEARPGSIFYPAIIRRSLEKLTAFASIASRISHAAAGLGCIMQAQQRPQDHISE